MRKMRILFVCTGNSARSQMAEAFARHNGGALIEAWSAGLEPTRLNPRAVAVMAEKGILLEGHFAKGLDAVPAEDMDLVVTLCDDDRCALLYGRQGRRHWPLQDPSKAGGTDEQVMAVFRSVRDAVEQHVNELIREIREAQTSQP